MDNKECIDRLKIKLQQATKDLNFHQTEGSKIYNKIEKETYETAIKALKKQLPTKPIIESWSPALCPSCKCELSENEGDGYYHHLISKGICECGQKLDWSDING